MKVIKSIMETEYMKRIEECLNQRGYVCRANIEPVTDHNYYERLVLQDMFNDMVRRGVLRIDMNAEDQPCYKPYYRRVL